MSETIIIEGLTNAEFFERYAAPGRIGLFGGPDLINRMIRRAQRRLKDDRARSEWSHAFLFQGRRQDGHHWVIESDLDVHRRHIRLGVQENRAVKYHDDAKTTALAILDFNLTEEQVGRVIASALDHVADHTRYSLRELAGVAWAMRNASRMSRENILARDRTFFCSAFVRHAFAGAGIDLAPGIDEKITAPEHIACSPVPHTKWLLVREPTSRHALRKRIKAKSGKAKAKVKAGLKRS